MSGQEVVPPSDSIVSSSDGNGDDGEHSTITTVLLSILSVLVLFGVLGGVAFGVMQISIFFQDYLNRGVEAAALKNLDELALSTAAPVLTNNPDGNTITVK